MVKFIHRGRKTKKHVVNTTCLPVQTVYVSISCVDLTKKRGLTSPSLCDIISISSEEALQYEREFCNDFNDYWGISIDKIADIQVVHYVTPFRVFPFKKIT